MKLFLKGNGLLFPLLLSCFVGLVSSATAQPITLLARNAEWKYWSYGEMPNEWKTTGYDDWFWLSGPGPFGYGEGDEQTLIYDDSPGSAPPTIYFRTTFVVTNRPSLSYLTLRFLADDGVVLYLNGQEIHRRNMPTGPVYFEMEALTNVETNENKITQLGLWPYGLVQGTNYLSAELHQYLPGRDDGSFELELIANLPLGRPNVTITSPTERSLVATGPIQLAAEATDPSAGIIQVVYYTNGVYFGAATKEPFSMVWTNPPKGGHAITATAVNNFYVPGESAPVHVYVGTPVEPKLVSGPYLQSGSSTGMVVRWRTDWFSDSVVRFGPNQLSHSATNTADSFDHEVKLVGLQPDTQYGYAFGSSAQTLGAGNGFYFRTSPANARPVRLWVLGDSGSGDANAAAVRDAYYAFNGSASADLLLMLGDNAYGSGTDSQYQQAVFNFYPELLRNTVLWPAIGNHDAAGEDAAYFRAHGGPYLDLFTLPRQGECGGLPSGSELYYAFDYGNIHFICLDSFISDRATNSPMLTWLENDLAATDKDWIIAFWHHPPYTWGTHNSDGEEDLTEVRERFLPLLEAYGVDLVLCGHSHVYERSFLLNGHYGRSSTLEGSMVLDGGLGRVGSSGPYRKPSGGLGANQGTVYAVCGCSGEGNQLEGRPLHPAMALNHGGFGSMVIDVDGLRLTARFLRPSQAVEDEFTIDKTQPATVKPQLKVVRRENGLLLSWPTSNPSYSLEQSPWLPSMSWEDVPQAPQRTGRQNAVTLDPASSAGYFRLRSP